MKEFELKLFIFFSFLIGKKCEHALFAVVIPLVKNSFVTYTFYADVKQFIFGIKPEIP